LFFIVTDFFLFFVQLPIETTSKGTSSEQAKASIQRLSQIF
jgi:hypothetical protein